MNRFIAIFCLLVTPLAAGCTGEVGEFPTVPVTLKFVYQGQPLEGASVTMVNASDYGKPIVAVGKTGPDGVVKMQTYAPGDGAVKGDHVVMVAKVSMDGSEAAVADVESEDYDPNVAPDSDSSHLVPFKYSTQNSGLTLSVGDSPVEEEFELTD